uniref:Chorismate lyase n=1 Tax=Riquetophycus sp. TaxID=1897556 RepID=A0A1C9C860_9FLOR|nr:hypothetical protein Riqu_089 [Riquetophycus sp.]
MHMNAHYKFKKIWTISLNNINNKQNIAKHNYIPLKWQLLLTSDGSFTQNLTSLTGNTINLNIISTFIYKSFKYTNHIREVCLQDTIYQNLAFAKSTWPIYKNNKITEIKKLHKKPVGQVLIESKIDIYKDIDEIYYGYCEHLENQFQIDEPIWGRKYTIYYKNYPLTTIQEIFSPNIVNFFV